MFKTNAGTNILRVGIISAIESEVKLLLQNLTSSEVQDKLVKKLYLGRIRSHDIVLVCSGVGKVKSAAYAQYIIDCFQVECIISIGIAGAINPYLKVGDIVVSDRAIEHDCWQERWYQADRGLIEAAINVGKTLDLTGKLLTGSMLTGDQPCVDTAKKNQLWQYFAGDCVEMEGAAVAHVCWMNAVPFLIIRVISDLADEKTTDEIKRTFKEVVNWPARILAEMVNSSDLLPH